MVYSYDHMKNSFDSSLQKLGQMIKAERKARGLTQTELGNLSKTSINFISQIEAGKSTAHIGKVFQVLQILGFEMHFRRGQKGLVLSAVKDHV